MAHDVFVSYSNKDKAIADAVVAALESSHIRCWYAPRDIQPSQDWGNAIIDAVEQSRVFLLIFSSHANRSQRVLDELNFAVSRETVIFPFRVENLEPQGAMQLHLSSRQWLDAFEPSWQRHLKRLVKDIGYTLEEDLVPEQKSASSAAASSSNRKVAGNPFTFGNAIRDPRSFIGREEEIRQVTNRLLSSARESTSIVGERRIGKTSLLKYLANPDVAARFGLDPDAYCLVYIDFQGLNDITPQRFWQRVLSLMARSMGDHKRRDAFTHFSQQEVIDLFDLEDLFESVSSEGTHVVLLMDEFEYVTQNPNFNADFFGALRSLAIHYDLSLVPATRCELVELCHSEEIKGSPFFNIFATVVLKPFSSIETDKLLDTYARQAEIDFSDDERHFIHATGGGYPFFVQMICHYLLEGMQAGLQDQALLDDALQNFNRQADPHFAYLWSRASDSEKSTLLAVLALRQDARLSERKLQPISLPQISAVYARAPRDVQELEKRGSLVTENGGISIFSSSFANWISTELTAAPDEQESADDVEQWLQANLQNMKFNLSHTRDKLITVKKKYWPVAGRVFAGSQPDK